MALNKIRVAGTINGSIVDGVGMRYVVFCQGCRHSCSGCFNPDSHAFDGGKNIDSDEIIRQIENNPLISGVTFSGGECWEQADKCIYIAEKVKNMGLDVWSYTGYEFEYILTNMKNRSGWEKFISLVDVLIDGKFEESQRDLTLTFRGSRNQRIIDVSRSLRENKTILYAGY